MTRVINIGNQAISLDHITINPKDSHTWLNSEVSFTLRRRIWKLRGMGLIQVEEYSDLSDINEISVEEIKEPIIEEEIKVEEKVEETSPKPKKKNSRKKSQRKEE